MDKSEEKLDALFSGFINLSNWLIENNIDAEDVTLSFTAKDEDMKDRLAREFKSSWDYHNRTLTDAMPNIISSHMYKGQIYGVKFHVTLLPENTDS